MPERNDTYVFISYSRQNEKTALDLYHQLSGHQHRIACWMDQFDIPVDEDVFQKHILRAIRHASALVLVKSEESLNSPYVEREVREAHAVGIPVYNYRLSAKGGKRSPQHVDQGEGSLADPAQVNKKISFLKRVKIALLAFRIKLQLTQPFWFSIFILILFLFVLGGGVYWISKNLTPVMAESLQRNLPDVENTQPVSQAALDQDPKSAAPFYFFPDEVLFGDEFEGEGYFDADNYYFDIPPDYYEIVIDQTEGVWRFDFPPDCTLDALMWDCEMEIHSQNLDLEKIQYFGLRARSLINTERREISISIAEGGPERYRTGFGWAFSNHVTPYFRGNTRLLEEDYYAYLPLDEYWHSYEILLDPLEHRLFFYVDGQLIDTVSMHHYDSWRNAPLMLLVYQNLVQPLPEGPTNPFHSTQLEIDQVVIGSIQ
jgi:hypothetical protein